MMEVLLKGIEVTVQDYPGRIGYWNLGIPPSGPMDDLSFRIGNLLVGNPQNAAGLEITVGLFKVKFHEKYLIAITGAGMDPKLNGETVPLWRSFIVNKGDVLEFGPVGKVGARSYLCISGGIDVPKYLGSRATFAAGRMGGYKGRTLEVGDKLKIGKFIGDLKDLEGRELKSNIVPSYSNEWVVEAMPGPQANPDFFTDEDMEFFFSAKWKVDRNSNRLGYRLNTHEWSWARKDGGIAGLHPSNILDNGYAVGAINVCGDQPIILTNDGPSLGGFVCNAVVIKSSLWKIGQAMPGRDIIRFKKVNYEEAIKLREEKEKKISLESLK